MKNALPLDGLAFRKMHGLGNDFVVVDLRDGGLRPSTLLISAIGDRRTGVGFDQFALIETDSTADVRLTFFNADGSQAGACGNATRCIAAREMALTGAKSMTLRTERGMLAARAGPDGMTAVNMGPPLIAWDEIPLTEEMDTLELPIEGAPVATGMGNPHCTFVVADADVIPLETFGPRYEHHPLFPERTNVEVVQVLSHDAIRLRIWERGTGVTLASGSCSCAAVVATARRGLTGRRASVQVDGGLLEVDWRDDGVWLSGPSAHVFDGNLTPAFLEKFS